MVAAGMRRASFAALFVSLVLGCSSSAHNPSCKAQADCGSGLTCSASECVAVGECASTQASCIDNSTCAAGSSCVSNCCAPFSGCRSNNDCVSTAVTPVCNTTTNTCAACGSNNDCLAGTICTSTGACSQGCGSDTNCATGQTCLTGANGKFCGATGSTPTVGLTPATGAFIRAGDATGSAFPTHLTLTLSFALATPTTVTVTAADADVTIANAGAVTIAAGVTSAEVQVSATSAHPAEQLTATLGASTSTATIRVLGATEQPSSLTLTPAAPTLGVGGSQTFTLTTDLPVPPSTTVTVGYGALAADFPAAPTTVAFTSDATVQTFVVPVDAAATPGSTAITATLGALSATSNVTISTVVAALCSTNSTPSQLVISQIYGGGGSTQTSPLPSFKYDFIELHNRGTDPFVIGANQYSVQYHSEANQTGSFFAHVLAPGTIPPGGFWLIRESTGTTPSTGADIPTFDDTGVATTGASNSALSMSATTGKVALVFGANALTYVGTTPTPAAGDVILDFIGYGPGGTQNFEGTAAASILSTTAGDIRANSSCQDTDQNSTDFTSGTPTLRGTASGVTAPAVTCAACGGTQ